MADCLSCDHYATCDMDKISAKIATGKCKDYVELRVNGRKKPKICKYCGKEIKGGCREVCDWCWHRRSQVKRFAKARDELRELLGLPPLEDNNYDT